jgi:hypothetical protein
MSDKVRKYCALYRHYREDGTLLYVGQTITPLTRQSDHRRHSPWWRDIARIEIQHIESASVVDMNVVEEAAIERERPLYNTVYSGPRSRPAKVDLLLPIPFGEMGVNPYSAAIIAGPSLPLLAAEAALLAAPSSGHPPA